MLDRQAAPLLYFLKVCIPSTAMSADMIFNYVRRNRSLKNALPMLRQRGKKQAISNEFSNKFIRKILEMAFSSDLTQIQNLSGF